MAEKLALLFPCSLQKCQSKEDDKSVSDIPFKPTSNGGCGGQKDLQANIEKVAEKLALLSEGHQKTPENFADQNNDVGFDKKENSVESPKECDIFLKTTSNRGQDDVQAKNVAEKSALLISRPNSSENNSVQNTGKVNSFEEAKKGRKGFNSQSNLTKLEAGTGHGRLGSYGVGKLARISKEDRYEKFRQNSKEKFAHLNSLEKNESNYPNLSDGHDQRLSQQSDQISRSAVNSISGAHRSKLPISNGGCGVQKDSKRLSSLVNSTFDDASEKVRENLPNRPGIFCEESMEKFRENNIEIFRKAFVDSHYLVKAG